MDFFHLGLTHHSKLIHIICFGILFILAVVWYSDQAWSSVKIQTAPIQQIKFKNFTFPQSTKIFCIILTHEKYVLTRAEAVRKTWAQECDDFKLVLKFTQKNSDKSNSILEPPGLKKDIYKRLTDKVYLTFKHVYLNYPDFDWYLKADDDTYVFFDNLRAFLADKNPNEPVSYGQLYNISGRRVYNSGGAGYVLSSTAFKKLGSKLNNEKKFCPNTGFEDVDLGACLKQLNVTFGNTLDKFGKERFNHINIRSLFKGIFPIYLQKYTRVKPVRGLNCCSDDPISFHKMREKDIYKLHELVKKPIESRKSKKYVFKDYVRQLSIDRV